MITNNKTNKGGKEEISSEASDHKNEQKTRPRLSCKYLFLLTALVLLNTIIGVGLYYTHRCSPVADATTWRNYQIKNCTVYALSAQESSPDQSENKLPDLGVWRGIFEADVRNFVELAPRYAKDGQRVFFEDMPIKDADPDTFSNLSGLYSRDKSNIYWQNQLVQDASPDGFKLLPAEPDLALQADRLYYQGQLLEESHNHTELGIVNPGDRQPVFPGESIVVRWNAGLYFDLILIQLIDDTGSTFWLTDRPVPNTGTSILTIPADTTLQGTYSIKIIGLSRENQLARYALQTNALMVEDASVKLYVNNETPDESHINVTKNQSLRIQWATHNVTNCSLVSPLTTRKMVADTGLIVSPVDQLSTYPGSFSLALDCQTKSGRPIGDQVSLFIGNAPTNITLVTPATTTEQADGALKQLSKHIFTYGDTVYFDAGSGTLRPKTAIDPEEITIHNERFISTTDGVWYRSCGQASVCYLVNLPGVDSASFSIINDNYIKDANNVYLILTPPNQDDHLQPLLITEADPLTFTLLGHLFAKDSKRVFYAEEAIPEADPDTFAPSPISMSYQNAIMFKDINHTFMYEEADPKHPLPALRARPTPIIIDQQ